MGKHEAYLCKWTGRIYLHSDDCNLDELPGDIDDGEIVRPGCTKLAMDRPIAHSRPGLRRTGNHNREPGLRPIPARRSAAQFQPFRQSMGGSGDIVRQCQVFGLAAAIICPIGNAFAQAPPASRVCRLEPAGTGKVIAVADGRSFLLDDGREIRLPAIEVPLPPQPGETGTRANAGKAARAALTALLA
jgi:hypothetical protein